MPTSLLSATPSSTPSETPSSIPTLQSTCPKAEIKGRTFYAVFAPNESCWKIELKEGGLISTNGSSQAENCSEGTFIETLRVSEYASVILGNTVVWKKNAHYSYYQGTMLFVESNEVIEPTLELLSLNGDTFDVVIKLPSCNTP